MGALQEPSKAEQVTYQLLNGDLISGELLKEESTEDVQVIMHKYLGRIEVKSSSIFHPKVKKWFNNLEIGLDGSNTKSSNSLGYLLEVNAKYRDNIKELNLGTKYDFKQTSESGKETITEVEKALTKIRFDRSIKDGLSSYISTDYEYNALNKIGVNDIKSSTGIAYHLMKNSHTNLRVSAGPSLEWIDGGRNCYKEASCGEIQPGLSFGTDLKWSINKKLELLFDNTYNTQLLGHSFASNKFSTAIRFFPSIHSDLYTSLSYENIYDQIKEPSQEHIYKLKIGSKF